MSTENGRLSGKAALITGSGSGIGKAIAAHFAREGASVAAIVRRDEHFRAWQGVPNIVPIKADLGKPADIDRMVDEAESRFGKLDIVCNVAGIHDLLSPLEDTTDELWDRVIATDLTAPFRICRRAIKGMVRRGSGAILNYGSVASLRGLHGPSYCAAKAGLIGMTASIAVQYGGKGIRCNIINSGGVYTDITEHSGGQLHPEGERLFRDITNKLPVNWNCKPEDVAPIALFLCSDDSKHINGAIVPVDGGMSAC
jgi:NAD(P)-dependent dehydrogenase (short-subunit alcohol dehydrogenase family)